MKKNNVFFTLILCMTALGCKTDTINGISNSSNIQRLEEIDLGDSKSIVEKKIGKPSEYREFNSDELWNYDNKSSGRQFGMITFDSKSQKVKGITFVPDIESNEAKIDFLLKQKFIHIKFEEISPNRCQKDFIPTSVFYVSQREGIIIRYNRHSQFVESYSKIEKIYLDEVIKSIATCS